MSKPFHCLKCGFKVMDPKRYRHAYNAVAVENHCCTFGCLIAVKGIKEAERLLNEFKEARREIAEFGDEKPQERV